MKKFILTFAAVLVLCVPAFADVSNDNYFGTIPGTIHHSHGDLYLSQDSGVSYFYLWQTTLYFIGEDAGYVSVSGKWGDGSSATGSFSLLSSPYGDYTFYDRAIYWGSLSGVTSTPSVNVVPSNFTKVDIGQAFNDFLNNQNNPDEPVGVTSVLVPRGNVLYFKAASDYVFGFEAEFTKYSSLLGGGDVYGPWGDTYQRLSIESSLPGQGITFPRPNSTAISWEKGAPYNVLGQSKRGLYRTSVEADGNYVAFYNPAYQSITGSDGDGSAEVGCNVWVTGDFDFIRIYPLQQLLDTSSSPDGFENYLNGTPDGDTVIWTDPDDNVSAPVSGGDNQEDEPISSVSLIEAIKRILRNILSEIENIFTFGFSAIRDLVDLMDEFVATFDDLYEWLPEECYTLLIASVSVAIVIGVFKVFL